MEVRDGSTQTAGVYHQPTQALTRAAQLARDRLRYAESLRRGQLRGRRVFTDHERALLHALAAGTLRTQANEATWRSGWGRIKHEDGSWEDVAPHGGGIVRKLLDRVVPTRADDSDMD